MQAFASDNVEIWFVCVLLGIVERYDNTFAYWLINSKRITSIQTCWNLRDNSVGKIIRCILIWRRFPKWLKAGNGGRINFNKTLSLNFALKRSKWVELKQFDLANKLIKLHFTTYQTRERNCFLENILDRFSSPKYEYIVLSIYRSLLGIYETLCLHQRIVVVFAFLWTAKMRASDSPTPHCTLPSHSSLTLFPPSFLFVKLDCATTLLPQLSI